MKRTCAFVIALAVLPLVALADEKAGTRDQPPPPAQNIEKARSVRGSPAPVKSETARTNSSASEACPVICFIEKQDRTITVKAGPKGTVYSVKTRDGKVLCENVSLDQLRAQAPELHDFIKSAIVLKSEKSDARLRIDAAMR